MISAIVLSKNEEKNIIDCLSGLKWCDEILVIDDCSEDKTVSLARKFGAKVIVHPLDQDFSKQRNFGLKEAKYDWILFIDADERVSSELSKEIQQALEKNHLGEINGFYFRRIDFFEGKWLRHGEIKSIRLLRLGKRGSGVWERRVDEIWKVSGQTTVFKKPLEHFSHPDLTSFLTQINERSCLNALQFYEEGVKADFFQLFKPGGKFLLNYVVKVGFLDGLAGFVFSVLMSFHSFLVRGKLYLLWKKGGGWK